MTSRLALNKLASILFRHVEHYVLTAKADAGSRVVVCTDMPELFTSTKITMLSPEQFMAMAGLDTPWQMRLDVITVPTYPADDLDTLITALLPGCGGRMEPLGKNTPAEIISAFSDKWHEAANLFNISNTDPELVELRYDIGQSRYSHTPKPDGYTVPGYYSEFSSFLPRNSAGDINNAALQRNDRFFDYFDDHIWMRRMFYEMVPVAAYQMLCFGSVYTSRQPFGHIEEYCYMPMITGMAGAETVMRAQMAVLNSVIDAEVGKPLGYVLSCDTSNAVESLNWTGCPTLVNNEGEYTAGLYGLDQRIVSMAAGYRPLTDLNHMDKVKLYQKPELVRARLRRQHESDAIWQFIDQAFFDEVH